MGRDNPKDDPLKNERKKVEKTERQIQRGSFTCGCGASFGSALLLEVHEVGCDGE